MYSNRQLEIFLKTADAGSFSKAASELYITSTAIMKQINLLEENLKLKLFIRNYRGLILTEAGKSFYKDTKYIIQYSKDSVIRAKNAVYKEEDIVRIGVSFMTPGTFLSEIQTEIYKYYPDIKIKLVPFENTPENAREILKNLGENIDIVVGIFDYVHLKTRGCKALEFYTKRINCGVPLKHKLSDKNKLTIKDMYNERIMIIKYGWNTYVDNLRNHIYKNHSQIEIMDFDFYNLDIFNKCENQNTLLMTVDLWKDVHPLIKIIPVDWEYSIPFGLVYSPKPSKAVEKFLNIANQIIKK